MDELAVSGKHGCNSTVGLSRSGVSDRIGNYNDIYAGICGFRGGGRPKLTIQKYRELADRINRNSIRIIRRFPDRRIVKSSPKFWTGIDIRRMDLTLGLLVSTFSGRSAGILAIL